MKNNLFESIKSNLAEGTTYLVAPSYNDNDGYSSKSNTEVVDAARQVAQYFEDYAQFLVDDEEGQRYRDRELAPMFSEFAKVINEYIDKIVPEWEQK